ncbi:RagB/SusD family nutrient uptake outer membrane protein [Mucilaginibacter ximonensis]|uniref:RagB/SusD family nutrient uptake outer membrane protein n=1 Tax=Mucilaginibacter ximonensis TaxID=538021 RepID=A0ABW5Y8V3_9SPHI
MKKIKTYNQIILKGSLCFVMMFSALSCKKNLLDPTIITSIADKSAFDTPDRILAQVNGLYASLKSGQFYGGRLIIYNELRGDEFIMNKPNIVTGQQTWSQSVNSGTSEVNGLWSAGYATINSVNTFLAGLELNKSKVSATLYSNYSSEAKFLRALCYFALVQTYCQPYAKDQGASLGLPLRLQPEISSADNLLARSTVAQIYTQIISDLNAAEAGLPASYASASLNTTRASVNTAIALKTRVYLVMNKYADVITEAGKIVSAAAPYTAPTGVANKMEANVATVFGGSYVGPEALLSMPFTPTETPGTQNQLAYYFNISPGNGEFYLNAGGIISDPVYSSASTDARKGFVFTNTGQKWLSKYKVASTYSDYVPVIRYPEVLLNYAEALAQAGDPASITKAISLLSAVRTRSNAGYVFPPASIATQGALITTIQTERRIEFLGEGFRVPDLQRLQQTLPSKTAASGTAPAVAPTENKYIWPIPANETSINTLCVPNPS